MASIEFFLYSGNTATSELKISEVSSTGPWETLTLSGSKPLAEALEDWQIQANGAGLTPTFTFSLSNNQVSISTNSYDSWISGSSTLADLLGWPSDVIELEAGVSYTSTTTPLCHAPVLAVEWEMPIQKEDIDLYEFRGGRALAVPRHRIRETKVRVAIEEDTFSALESGPLLSEGKHRLIDSDDSSVFDEYLYGYLDCWIMPDSIDVQRFEGMEHLEISFKVSLADKT